MSSSPQDMRGSIYYVLHRVIGYDLATPRGRDYSRSRAITILILRSLTRLLILGEFLPKVADKPGDVAVIDGVKMSWSFPPLGMPAVR
jgi:hypothetical protein